ncbi:MAG: FtsX-like permease family protein [Bacillota bacterium]
MTIPAFGVSRETLREMIPRARLHAAGRMRPRRVLGEMGRGIESVRPAVQPGFLRRQMPSGYGEMMPLRILDRRLIRNIQASRAQMLATMAVIVMGLVAFTVLSTIAVNMADSLDRYYQSQSFADLHLDFSWTSMEAVQELRGISGVDEVEGRVVVETHSPLGDDHEPIIRLIGNREQSSINIPYLVAGRMPSVDGEVLLLDSFANANGISPGDTIPLVFGGEITEFSVVGLAKTPEYAYVIRDMRSFLPDDRGFGVGFMRLSELSEYVGGYGRMNSATILLEPEADPDDVKERIEDRLGSRGLRSVITRDEQLSHQMVTMELEGLQQVSGVIPVVFLGIAAVVIYMMLSRMIQEDRTAIGILKATGYRDGEILLHYLKHALLLGGVGAIVGLIMGGVLAGPFSSVFSTFFHIPDIRDTVDPTFYLVGVVLTMGFCGVTGLLAARGVLQIEPAQALRPPAPTPGSKNMIEILAPRFWRQISFPWRTVLRYIFRGKKRFFLGLMGVALTFTVILIPLYSYTMMMELFVDQYERMDLYDYAVTLEDPLEYREARELLNDVRVSLAEPFIEYPLTITRGWREESMLGRGLPVRAQLQRFESVDGGWVEMPARGILISEYMAGQLGVEPGDVVDLKSPLLPNREVEVEVAAVVVQYLGSGVYMSVEQMHALTGRGAGYSGLLVTSPDDVSAALAGTHGISSVQSVEDLTAGFMQYLDLLVVGLGFYVIVGGVLGFAILFNTISASVTERRREIASLRVLGYSKAEVFGLLVRENGLAVVFGLLLGLPMGYGLIALVVHSFSSELFLMPLVISRTAVVVTTAFTLFFVTLTMMAVRVRIWSMSFLEALTTRIS